MRKKKEESLNVYTSIMRAKEEKLRLHEEALREGRKVPVEPEVTTSTANGKREKRSSIFSTEVRY